jgi:hypothetical protein
MGRKRRSCVASHLLRVRLTERALCLNDCASDACFHLSQFASKLVLYWGGSPGRVKTHGKKREHEQYC